MGVQIPPWEGAILRGKGCPVVKSGDTLLSSVQKQLNRSRYCLGYGLGGPEESCVRWGSRSPHEKGQFWRKVEPIMKYRDTLLSPV